MSQKSKVGSQKFQMTRDSRGFTPTPISAPFRFFKMAHDDVRDLTGETTMAKAVSETKKPRGNWCRGFTAIELAVVVAIMAILLTVVILSFKTFRYTIAINTETEDTASFINRARANTISSKNDQQFGVHFQNDRIVMFQGTTYSAGASTNETHMLNSAISATTTVYGGGVDMVFQKVTGTTAQNSTTTLFVSGGAVASTTVVVYPTGVVSLQ